MVDNISVTNGKDAMFYTGESPWHRKGTKVDRHLTSKEAIVAAGLDYTVEIQHIFTEKQIIVPYKYATVRTDTDQVLGVVGTKYQVIQNSEAFGFFDSVVVSKEAIYETAGALGKGERIWILSKIPGDIEIVKDDVISKYILLSNSHDGTYALEIMMTPIRVVCQNTLNSALGAGSKKSFRIKHYTNFQEKIDEAKEALGITKKYYDTFVEAMNFLQIQKMTDGDMVELINNVFFPDKKPNDKFYKRLEADMLWLWKSGKGTEIVGVRETKYGAYNAVAEYVDHHAVTKIPDDSKVLKSIWYGRAAHLKQNALNYLLK